MGTLHEPGRPGDLPDARRLWRRWAGVALASYDRGVAEEASFFRGSHWIDGGGLHWDDRGCTWWVLKWFGDDRALLVGEDESSRVKFYEPAIDLLAGAPEWLPRNYLQDLIDANMVGCVYWFDDGVWQRAPYPEDLADDGLDAGLSALTTRAGALGVLEDRFGFPDDDAEMAELCDQLLDAAEQGAVTENMLRSFVEGMTQLQEQYYPADEYDADEFPQRGADDIAAMFALAERAGLDTPTWTGTLGARS